ncbi:MAG TPA: hypothetical protein VMV31_07030 [Terriglobales bacterium]|nr:hypothetical protein [Terriglobales bacterium]
MGSGWSSFANACRLRLRLRRELALHARLRRQELRAAGAGWWRARMRARIGQRRRLYRDCGAAPLALGDGLRVLRLPGVLPLLLLACALLLLYLPASAPRVRASLRGRLPFGPSNALWLVSPRDRRGRWLGVTALHWQRLRRTLPALAAFRYEHLTWDGHHGQEPITVVAMTGNLPALLGVRGRPLLFAPAFWRAQYRASAAVVGQALGLDNREVRVGGIVPAADGFLFRRAQAWAPLPPRSDPAERYLVIAPAPLVGMAAEPLARYFLDDMALARRGWALVLGLWLLLGLGDLARLARRQGVRRLHHAAAYWLYALATVACLGWLLLALCGYLVVYWPTASAPAVVLTLLGYLLLSLAGLRGCLQDQRYRCRTCLRRLRMPRGQGTLGGILLAAPATEYLCPHGHGKLLVPARPRQPHPEPAWRFAADWWQELTTIPSP